MDLEETVSEGRLHAHFVDEEGGKVIESTFKEGAPLQSLFALIHDT
jgi:hypothetical protein